jgi:hypothetical protein
VAPFRRQPLAAGEWSGRQIGPGREREPLRSLCDRPWSWALRLVPATEDKEALRMQSRMPPGVLRQLVREARRAARSHPDAEDFLQTVWLAAVEAGRDDLTCDANRRWFIGVLRKRALFDRRTARRSSRTLRAMSSRCTSQRINRENGRWRPRSPPRRLMEGARAFWPAHRRSPGRSYVALAQSAYHVPRALPRCCTRPLATSSRSTFSVFRSAPVIDAS